MKKIRCTLLALLIGVLCSSLALGVPSITKRLIEKEDIDLTQDDNASAETVSVTTSTGATMTMTRPSGGMFPWDNAYTRTIRPGDIVTKSPWVDVRAFMDGQSGRPTHAAWNAAQTTTELSEVFAAAIAGLPSTGGNILVPEGSFFLDNTVRITKRGVHIRGQGTYTSNIIFTPTVNNTIAFDFRMDPDTSILADCGLHGLRITSAPTAVSGKVAIRLYDVSRCYFSNLLIYNNANDNTAEGIRTMGRELTTIDRVAVYADKPLHIMEQVNAGGVDLDHFRFIDSNFLAINQAQTLPVPNPVITVDILVRLQRVIFENNNWSHGKHGFYWAGGLSEPISSLYVTFRNVAWEQSTDAAGYFFYIDHYIQGLQFDQTSGGSAGNGYYFRNVYDVHLNNTFYNGAGTVAIDVNNTVHKMTFSNAKWNQSSTFNNTGMSEIFAAGFYAQNIPSFALYGDNVTTTYEPFTRTDGTFYSSKQQFTLDNAATFDVRFTKTGSNTVAKYNVIAVKASDSATVIGGTVIAGKAGSPTLLDNTANFVTTAADGKLSIERLSGTSFTITNRLGYTIRGGVIMEGVY